MTQVLLPVLAAGDLQTIVGIVILTISFASWIGSWFQDKKPDPGRPRNRPRPNNAGQSELERFLQEVVKRNESDQKRPSPPKPPRPPAGEKKKSKPSSEQSPSKVAPGSQPTAAPRPATRLAPLPTSALGEGVRTHVASHMESRTVDKQVERDIDSRVRRDIGDAVRKDVRSDLGADSTLMAPRVETVHPLVQALRNPQTVRQAILMAEILNRPKSLR